MLHQLRTHDQVNCTQYITEQADTFVQEGNDLNDLYVLYLKLKNNWSEVYIDWRTVKI